MTDRDSYKDDLVAAYDSDVERRNAMTPAEWRTDIIDRFAESARALGAESVLELGCGTGQLARYVADKGFDVVAIDLSPENVAKTQLRGVTAEIADFASLPFPDNSFDASFAMNSLIHVPPGDLSDVLTEIARVLRPGSPLLVVVWGGITEEGTVDDEWLDPPRYFSSYSDEDLLALETPGFERSSFQTIDVDEEGYILSSQVLTLTAI